MKIQRDYREKRVRWGRQVAWRVLWIGLGIAAGFVASVGAHIVPPEKLHPAAESYRRMNFMLQLNPVLWSKVADEIDVVAAELATVASEEGSLYRVAIRKRIEPWLQGPQLGADNRKATAREVFELSTHAVARTLRHHLDLAGQHLENHTKASHHLDQARQLWSAFEPEIRAMDPDAFHELGECWLELASALGSPGILGVGAIAADRETFDAESAEVLGYLETSYGELERIAKIGSFSPIPAHSPTLVRGSRAPAKLPPGSDINKQLPRPRQVLNMATRGVDESETPLIALGDMAFDSALIFGEPARSLGITCNTCHNKSITNPNFFIPGLSSRPGNVDVSNSFFAPHANNGLFDPLDIPDLRGIRFTGPYGRNGRFASLREFTRNVIVNEFNGPEPDPILLDGMVAYMLEFDFLPNPALDPDGRLNDEASAAAKRGEAIFNRPFPSMMGGMACADCHVPSDHFVDRRRHTIGTIEPSELHARDGALDTPTLLSSRYSGPYFHDGSQPTLRAVNEWFNERFDLGLNDEELADLTAYVETVGDGVEAYEETVHTLSAELEEFSFFLSTFETLDGRGKTDLIDATFGTIAFEIRAHKWTVKDAQYLPVLDRLATLMDEARSALSSGDGSTVLTKVEAYRELYSANAEVLQ